MITYGLLRLVRLGEIGVRVRIEIGVRVRIIGDYAHTNPDI